MTTGEVIALIKAFGGSGGGSSGGGVLVVHQDENGVLDKTWQEIHDAGVSVLLVNVDSKVYVNHCMDIDSHGSAWSVLYANTERDGTTFTSHYVASSANGYPVYTE